MDEGAAAIFLALNFPNCMFLESIDLSVNGISDGGGSYLVSSLLTMFGAFDLYGPLLSPKSDESFLSPNEVAARVYAKLPPFPAELGSVVPSLTSIDLSRNRLGPKTSEGLRRILSLPSILPQTASRNPGSVRQSLARQRSASAKKLDRNPPGGGTPLASLMLGWNNLTTAGTKKIVTAISVSKLKQASVKGAGLKNLRLENTTSVVDGGKLDFHVEESVMKNCEVVTSFPAGSIGGFGIKRREVRKGRKECKERSDEDCNGRKEQSDEALKILHLSARPLLSSPLPPVLTSLVSPSSLAGGEGFNRFDQGLRSGQEHDQEAEVEEPGAGNAGERRGGERGGRRRGRRRRWRWRRRRVVE